MVFSVVEATVILGVFLVTTGVVVLLDAELTVKLTVKLCDVILAPPLTVTVAVYVPAASPVLGAMVKLLLPPTFMLLIDVLLNVKPEALEPDKVTFNEPVA